MGSLEKVVQAWERSSQSESRELCSQSGERTGEGNTGGSPRKRWCRCVDGTNIQTGVEIFVRNIRAGLWQASLLYRVFDKEQAKDCCFSG